MRHAHDSRAQWRHRPSQHAGVEVDYPEEPQQRAGERAEKTIFKSKGDPDYQAICKTFEPTTELMRAKPRLDFPGSKCIPHSRACPPKNMAKADK
ncbi:MAG: hypothetical protein ISS69_17255 [Phycisphaerae bacterium]|nr:hypothetical protein [Planctomycetota bacterium]MBL7221860.1 hypothetical protein [Phycisphaerae bacterium]